MTKWVTADGFFQEMLKLAVTLTAGMIPWSDNGIYMATILGVATFEYLPYMWLSFSCIALAIIFGFTGLFNDEK